VPLPSRAICSLHSSIKKPAEAEYDGGHGKRYCLPAEPDRGRSAPAILTPIQQRI